MKPTLLLTVALLSGGCSAIMGAQRDWERRQGSRQPAAQQATRAVYTAYYAAYASSLGRDASLAFTTGYLQGMSGIYAPLPLVPRARTLYGSVNGEPIWFIVNPPVGNTVSVYNGQTGAMEMYTIY
jgi:hypothetical protein